MALSYAFGGNTGLSYDDLQRRRMFAEGLMQRGMSSQPKTAIEGLNSAASSVMGALLAKKLGAEETKGRDKATSVFQDIISGGAMTPPSESMAPENPNDKIGNDAMAALIRTGLTSRGIPEHTADGFIMNFADESGLNPSINEASPLVPGSRGGFGLAQWTGPRRVALEKFAAEQGKPVSDMNLQLDFLVSELKGPEAAAAKDIFAAPDAGSAATAIVNKFLRPAEQHRAARAAEYGGMDPRILSAMSDPYLSDGQRSALGILLEQQIKANDPANQMALEKAQLELEQMRQPGFRMTTPEEAQAYGGPGQIGPDNRYYPAGSEGRGTPAVFEALKLRAAAAGLQEGTPEYEQFMLTGGGGIGESRPAAFEALHQQALAAGLQEGSPDYQKFMLTKGAGDAAAAKAVGEQQGAATAAAPAEIAAADETLGYITEARNHVGLDRGTGLSSIFNAVPGTKGYDFKNRVKQLSSGAFLTAIDQLRGMGSLSNAEGQTATAAVTRLDTATSKEEFLSALSDYERIVNMGRARAEVRVKSGKNASATPPAGSTYTYNPATGELE